MNANPNDTTTPYIDIVERTGSGVYDVELKARLGDLSGLSSGLVHGEISPGFGLYSENVFLTGGIVANTGSIAGVQMQDDQLYIGDGNHNNTNTPFYVSGKNDATSGDFSLSNKLVWDASAEALTVVGSITVVSGQVFDQMAALGTSTASLQGQANALGVATASLSQGSASMAAVATLTGTGLAIKNASGQLLSDFGGNIHMGGIGGTIYVGVTGSAGDWVEIDSTSIDIMRNNVSVGSWADSTFRVGAAASEHIEIDSGGMRVNDGTTMLSKFGSNIHLNSGTIYVGVTGSSADWVQLDSTAIEIIRNNVSVAQFADSSLRLGADANNSSFVEIGTNSMNFIVDSSGTNATKASFGANTTITGGEITIQGTTGADGHEKLKIWAGNIGIYTNNARRIAIDDDGIAIGRSGSADTTTSTTAHQVTINNNGVYSYHNAQNYSHVGANGLKIYQASNEKASFGADVVLTGGTITIRSSTGTAGDDRLEIGSNSVAMYCGHQTNKSVHIADSAMNIGPSADAGEAVAGNIRMESGGVWVYGEATNDYVRVHTDKVEVVTAGTTVAEFGATTLVGDDTTEHVEITNSHLKLSDG